MNKDNPVSAQQSTINQLVSRLSSLEDIIEGVDIRTDYSGRFMFGKNCIGITHDKNDEITVAMAVKDIINDLDAPEDEKDWLIQQISRPSHDNMGLSVISYYPQLQASK